jgi:acetate---CoA ligase (ADP-forming)
LPDSSDGLEINSPTDFEQYLNPKSIAIVGASGDPGKVGGRVVSNLRLAYGGNLGLVNRNGGVIQGLQSVRQIQDLGWAPDVAIIAVPRDDVRSAIRQCGEVGTRYAVVLTAGFAEIAFGDPQQRELTEMASDYQMRLIGPNCVGSINVPRGIYATFGELGWFEPKPGNIALVSQSGALGLQLFHVLQAAGRGVSYVSTTGNEADVTAAQIAAALIDLEDISVMGVVIESFSRPADLISLGELSMLLRKPVVLLCLGQSDAGATAARSHTGAVAVPTRILKACVDQFGFIEVRSLAEFVTTLTALSCDAVLPGKRAAVLTGSGGLGILGADAAERERIELPNPSGALSAALAARLPDFAALGNPIDWTAQIMSDIELMSEIPNIVAESGEYDILCIAQVSSRQGDSYIEKLKRLKENNACLVIGCTQEPAVSRKLNLAGIAAVYDPGDAMQILGKLWRFHLSANNFTGSPRQRPHGSRATESRIATEPETAAMLRCVPMELKREHQVLSVDDAVAFWESAPGAIALKVATSVVIHRSDVGALRLGLDAPREITRAFHELADLFGPSAVVAQEMVDGGLELAVGAYRDAAFGPVVMVGLGGRLVEVLQEQELALAPVSAGRARELIGRLCGGRLVADHRGIGAAAAERLAAAIVAVADVVCDDETIAEIDVNPVLVNDDRLVAVDALVVRRDALNGT